MLSDLKIAFLETRPQFLILSVTLVMIGSSAAFYSGYIHIPRMVLAFFGLVALHMSVNVLNDYHDFKSGIDLHTRRTPFSGGSGFLPQGKISPEKVHYMGIISLGIGTLIGIYFILTVSWKILPFLILAVIAVYFYNPLLSKLMVGEILAGLGLGILPVLGIFFVIAGKITPLAFFAGIPPFFLTFNLLFLNEFPDSDADKLGGRRHLVIFLGKKKAGILYSIITVTTYISIISGVILRILPTWTLLALLTLPVGLRAIKGALKDFNDFEKLIPAQGANVMVVLGTQALLALGFLIAAI